MTRLIKGLKIFAAAWAVLITLSFAIGAIHLWLSEGLLHLARSFHPLNIQNVMIFAFSYAPAVVGYILADVLGGNENGDS